MTGPRRLDKVGAFGRGRVCAASECTTVLSMYNPSPYCVLHDDCADTPARPKPRKVAAGDARACANPSCEEWFESPNPKRRFCSDRCRMEAFQERKRRDEAGP